MNSAVLAERIGVGVVLITLAIGGVAWLDRQRAEEAAIQREAESLATDPSTEAMSEALDAWADLMTTMAEHCSDPENLSDACTQMRLGPDLVQGPPPTPDQRTDDGGVDQ